MTVTINKGSALSSLSMTPLIDVVFLLLIFFLVATRFAEEDRELDVSLPAASEAKPLVVKVKELFVNIDAEGKYFVAGEIVEIGGVEDAMRRAARDNPVNQSVIIRADRRTQLERVVQVINLCTQMGLQHKLTTSNKN